jgi:predicted membrane chloride channel (bestrophin family)
VEVAIELEDPFGDDANDLPMEHYQDEFNCRLATCASLNVGRCLNTTMHCLYERASMAAG